MTPAYVAHFGYEMIAAGFPTTEKRNLIHAVMHNRSKTIGKQISASMLVTLSYCHAVSTKEFYIFLHLYTGCRYCLSYE